MKRVLLVLLLLLAFGIGCSNKCVTVGSLFGKEHIEVQYLRNDGRWVPADSLSWKDRSWCRELRFDTDGDGEWNYLYREIFDDVIGWMWIPSSTRVNPDEEPDLANKRKYLVRPEQAPPARPSADDFGYSSP